MAKKALALQVDHVSMKFNLSSQKVDNMKEYFIKFCYIFDLACCAGRRYGVFPLDRFVRSADERIYVFVHRSADQSAASFDRRGNDPRYALCVFQGY